MSSATLSTAVALHREGQLSAAESLYRELLAGDPRHVDALHLLGVIALQRGDHAAAIDLIRRAIAQRGDQAAFYNNLGTALEGRGLADEALASFRHALAIDPACVDALNNLGLALQRCGLPDEALATFDRALSLQPDSVDALINRGSLLTSRGRINDAIVSLTAAVAINPAHAAAHHQLGNALKDQRRLEDACLCYRRALELRPDFAAALNGLGMSLTMLGQSSEAESCLRRGLAIEPNDSAIHNNLGNALNNQGRTDEALACYRRAVELNPGFVVAHSNALNTLQYQHGITRAELAAAHAEFNRQHALPLAPAAAPIATVRGPSRPLRVGFVSADLWQHPVGYFLFGAITGVDRSRIEPCFYTDLRRPDNLTTRFRAAAAVWRETAGLRDDDLAAVIRNDGIDILVDLAGHTAGNRMLVFARRPAALQVTWLGYQGTTGLTAIDVLIADEHVVPSGSEAYCCERVLRLSGGYVCYEPTADMPAVAPLPATAAGFVRFGSFNNPAKISPETVAVWARVLDRVPGARLVLRYRGLDDPAVQSRLRTLFRAQGIEDTQLEMHPQSPRGAYLESFGQIDIGLDPFPFGGGITTCDSLWMGVPVVTLPGETFASRHSMSHIVSAGVTETIATSADDYVAIAVTLAHDLPRLAALRADLRGRMAAATLCDRHRLAAGLTQAFEAAWQERIGRPN
jgi:predicted O-linked N-acetylglucosamine transferase (SPINDLY family)